MSVKLKIRAALKGVMTVEAIAPNGRVLHREVQDNLIVDEGLNALKALELSGEMTQVCILGRSAAAPTAADEMAPTWLDAWTPQGGGSISQAYTDADPLVQPRTIVAASQDSGGIGDVWTYVAGPPRYWSLVRTRQFTYEDTYFKAATLPAESDNPVGLGADAWTEDGWTSLSVESSYITEVGFCGDEPGVPEVANALFAGILSDGGDVNAPLWTGPTFLWNRVVLAQSIGYEMGESSIYYPWNDQVADVLFPTDTILQVTLELRIYPDVTPNIEVVDVDGESTTCTTYVADVDGARWGSGGLSGRLGNWPSGSAGAAIAETVTPPATPEDDYAVTGGTDQADTSTYVATAELGEQVMSYVFGSSKGLFATGIGAMIHGDFGGEKCFLTTFSPKIAKTDTEKITFNVRYQWSRV